MVNLIKYSKISDFIKHDVISDIVMLPSMTLLDNNKSLSVYHR